MKKKNKKKNLEKNEKITNKFTLLQNKNVERGGKKTQAEK